MSSTHSGDVKKKFDKLNLKIDKDYRLGSRSQPVKQGGFVTQNQYMLTPEAFKKCLMRARRSANQSVDPTIYCDYYLRLEQAFKLYTDYERQYAKCLLAIKDDKIDSLTAKVDSLLVENKQQSIEIQQMLTNSYHIINQNSHLNTKVTDLSTQVSDLHAEVAEVNDKLTALFDFMLSFARMTIPTWIGSSIIKQQYDTLAINKDSTYALKHLKIMFMVGFYLKSDHPVMLHTKVVGEQTIQFKGRGNMKIYACCTNFADIGPRLKLLYGRHNNDDTYHAEMLMFKAVANTLISCEVNSERIILENADEIFPERSIVTWDSKYKSFDVAIDTAHYSKAANIFKAICNKANGLRFQDYQQRIDQFDETTDVKLDPKIITYINEVDQRFFASTKPFCQQFINSYLRRSTAQDTGELVGYTYGAPTRKCQVRADLNGANMTTNAYALRKIELTIDEHTAVDHIQHMTEHGILSKEDLPALRAIAKYKNLDTTTLDEELEEYQDELDALGNH